MISLKRFLERGSAPTAAEKDLLEKSLQLRRLLEDGIAARSGGEDASTLELSLASRDFVRRLDEAETPAELLGIANEALDGSGKHARRIATSFREQSAHIHSMLGMLTAALVETSGSTHVSITRLQSIQRQIERASGPDDLRTLRASLESCLAAVKEATVEEKKATLATVAHLTDQVRRAPQLPTDVPPDVNGEAQATDHPEFVAAFKLQRADHILSRFGAGASDQMLASIGEGLKSAQGPNDRIMRWKGPAFVMFLSSSENIQAIKRRLMAAVRKIGQNHVELKNSALLAVGVDWVVFPQAEYGSLDVVLAEVDSFVGVKAQ